MEVNYYYFPEDNLYSTDLYDIYKTQAKILSLKAGKASFELIQKRARELKELFDTVIPGKIGIVIPLPRHTVGKNPSLEPVVVEIEKMSKGRYINGTGFIYRSEELVQGKIIKGRERGSADMHESSMKISSNKDYIKKMMEYPVILVDDVYTTGGTMMGAEHLLQKRIAQNIYKIAILKAGGKTVNKITMQIHVEHAIEQTEEIKKRHGRHY
jgi:phosphoribosylpyrophosphate synthetase